MTATDLRRLARDLYYAICCWDVSAYDALHDLYLEAGLGRAAAGVLRARATFRRPLGCFWESAGPGDCRYDWLVGAEAGDHSRSAVTHVPEKNRHDWRQFQTLEAAWEWLADMEGPIT